LKNKEKSFHKANMWGLKGPPLFLGWFSLFSAKKDGKIFQIISIIDGTI